MFRLFTLTVATQKIKESFMKNPQGAIQIVVLECDTAAPSCTIEDDG
jgi:hypothetical protein